MSRRISTLDFLNAYQPAFDQLQQFYRHAQFVGIATRRLPMASGREEVMRHTYLSNGPHLRVDSRFVEQPRSKTWAEWSRVTSPSMSFEATRRTLDDGYELRAFSRDAAKLDVAIRTRFPFASAPYHHRKQTIWELLHDPAMNISQCELDSQQGESIVRVHCQLASAPQAFTFSIDKAWALTEFWIAGHEYHDRIQVHYDLVGNMPILRRLQDFRHFRDGRVESREDVKVIEFVPSPAKEDAFALSALGIHGPIPTRDFNT